MLTAPTPAHYARPVLRDGGKAVHTRRGAGRTVFVVGRVTALGVRTAQFEYTDGRIAYVDVSDLRPIH